MRQQVVMALSRARPTRPDRRQFRQRQPPHGGWHDHHAVRRFAGDAAAGRMVPDDAGGRRAGQHATHPANGRCTRRSIWRYPAAQCVVHTHADACTALACLELALPPFHYWSRNFGGDDVRCAPYVTFGTPELAQCAVEALQGRTACLLANHGMIVHAATADRALTDAIVLETLCRQYLLARSAGTVRLLQRKRCGQRTNAIAPMGRRT